MDFKGFIMAGQQESEWLTYFDYYFKSGSLERDHTKEPPSIPGYIAANQEKYIFILTEFILKRDEGFLSKKHQQRSQLMALSTKCERRLPSDQIKCNVFKVAEQNSNPENYLNELIESIKTMEGQDTKKFLDYVYYVYKETLIKYIHKEPNTEEKLGKKIYHLEPYIDYLCSKELLGDEKKK